MRRNHAVELGFLVFFGTTNLFGPPFVAEFIDGLDYGWRDLVGCAVSGFMLSQLGFVATWLAMLPYSFSKRASVSSLVIVFLNLLYLVGWKFENLEFSAEVGIVFFVGSFVGIFVFSVPLWLYRQSTSHIIRDLSGYDTGAIKAIQFSVKQLLILTTLFALFVGLGKFVFANSGFQQRTPWGEVAIFCTFYLVLCGILILANLLAVFDSKWRPVAIVFLILSTFGILPFCSIPFSNALFGQLYTASELYGKVATFLSTFSLTMISGFSICKSAGFELYFCEPSAK